MAWAFVQVVRRAGLKVASGLSRQERYTRADLRQLRLIGLPFLLGLFYVAANAFAILPLDPRLDDRLWLVAVAPLLAMAILYAREHDDVLAGVLLVGVVLGSWTAALWLLPGEIVIWLSVLVVGTACTLFGTGSGLLAAALTSLAMVGVSAQGRLSTDLMMGGLLANWLGASLFWLTARPVAMTLEWAWVSYADARERQEQLREQQAKLKQTLKSLESAYRRLEHLNDELNRARHTAEEARRLKSEFAARVGHELRTPLNLILGFSEMMVTAPHTYGAGRLPPAYQADIDAIYRNARHLAGLVDDVLDLSQVEAGRMGLVRDPIDLAEIVGEAVRAIANHFDNRGLALDVALPANLPAVFADRTRIRQVLINLLNNAARFTDGGVVRVSAARDGGDVVVTVADTGVGIPPEALPRVFDEFCQIESSPQRQAGGSGLGLTICKQLVELNGGSIWVESEVGVGSKFSFTLPLTDNVATRALPGEWEVWDRVSRGREQALPALAVLAEDTLARTFARYLDGYRVLPAEDASDVAALAERAPLAGIIVASASPEEPWRALAQRGVAGTSLPVVACSVSGWHDRAAELGVSDYLMKPILRDEVRKVLSRVGKDARTVLIVDDSADMVRLLARIVRSCGRRYQVWQATSGEEALAIMRERRPDVVFMDLLMPGIDGYALLELMRSDERLRDVPVVVVTAHGGGSEMLSTGEVGVTRSGGLSVDEVMRCLKGLFDALAAGPADRSAPARSAAPSGSPASAAAPTPPGSAPAPLPAGPSK